MYKVEVAARGGYRFDAKSKDATIIIDAKSGGMTPPDVLLASAGSCIGVYIRKYAEGAKLPVGEFTVTVEGDLGSQPPYYFRRIDVTIDLKGLPLDEKRSRAMIDFIKNCPVHNTLKNGPDVDIKIR